jgi:excinuclease UvrABC ATPase subunit
LQSLAEEARVRSLDAVINKVVGQEIALADLNWEQAIQVSNELVKRIDQKKVRKHNKSLKEQNICNRCGGQGYSDNWVATGSVCYKCNGTGKAQ